MPGPPLQTPAALTTQRSMWWRWIVPPAAALAIWLLPHFGFPHGAWALLCLFAATIAALMSRPIPAGAAVFVAVTAGALGALFTIQDALLGFSNASVWLIVTAFLFSRGFVKTRLGERIAYHIVRRIGGSPLKLGYALVLADLAMAPMTPSNTARAGGILFPVTLSIARTFGSEPGPTASLIGAFLMKTLFQGDLVVSAMFLTAAAPNTLVAELTRQAGGPVLAWTTWAYAALVPGIVGLAAVPYVVYRLCPPALRETRAAQSLAADRLRALGPITRREGLTLVIFSLVLLLWLSGNWHGASPTTVACLGVAALLLTGVLEWQDVLTERGAWDALVWFGGLVMMAGQLEKAGLPQAFAHGVAGFVVGWPWWWALAALMVVYLYAHYWFASLVAHVTAMFPAFFAVAIGLGVPPVLAALAFGFFSSLNAATTHYGTGTAPILFGAGYLTQAEWWRAGFFVSLVHLTIWLPIGFLWWKTIGLW